MSVREDGIEFADGAQSIYGVVEKPDFVLVIPRDRDGFWLVNQYRHPIGGRAWEFPQGAWPHGESGSPEELARLELQQETGLMAAPMTQLGRLHNSHATTPQTFDVYLAKGLTPGPPDRETFEADLMHALMEVGLLDQLIRSGGMSDAPSLAALHLLRLRRLSTATK